MYRIAIVEDDPTSADKLKRYLTRFGNESGIELRHRHFKDGLAFISDYAADYDVILMDIEMPNLDGMQTARRLRRMDENVCLIFVTNLAKYALEGYEVRAMDFLVKPVEYQNFSLKLRRALDYRERTRQRELIVTLPGSVRRIPLDELYYIEVMDHTLVYHTASGDLSERSSIKERENQLSQYGFARCNNSFLVNLRYVTSMSATEITLRQTRIPIGRTKKKEFVQRLTEYMGDSVL